MARIPYLEPGEAGPKASAELEKLAPLNIFRAMAHADQVLGPFIRFGNAFLFKGALDPVLREIAILRVGHLSHADYEVFQHERIGRNLGMSEALLAAIKAGPASPAFKPLERDVMLYTDDVVRNVRASDLTYKALEKTMSRAELVELTLVIGFYMMVSRFLETFDIDIEEEGRTEGLKLPGKAAP